MNAAVQHNDLYSGETSILNIRNSIHVPNIKNHLTPPFIMPEAGIEVNDIHKVQIEDHGVKNHSLYFKDDDMIIPLTLNGMLVF